MADQVDKLIKPIKDVCDEIIKGGELTSSIEKLRKYSEKADFYESHTIFQVLDVVEAISVDKKRKHQIEELLGFCNELFQHSSKNYVQNLNRIYKLIHGYRDSLDVETQRMIVEQIKFKDEPIPTKTLFEYLLHCNKVAFKYRHCLQSKSSRAILISNLRMIIKNAPQTNLEKRFVFTFILTIIKEVSNYDKNVSNEILTQIAGAEFNIIEDELFHEYINFVNHVYAEHPTGSIEFVSKMQLKSKDHSKANEILRECLEVFNKELVTASDLTTIQKLFKGSNGGTNVQKVALIATKLMKIEKKYDITAETFTAYHHLVYDLLHVLSKIKNEPDIYPCCSDVKRHEIFSIITTVFPFAKKLITGGDTFTSKEAEKLDFHMLYVLQLSSELKCESKSKTIGKSFDEIYNTLFEIYKKKDKLMMTIAKEVDKGIKVLLMVYKMMSEEQKKTSQNPYILASHLLDVPYEASQAQFIGQSHTRLFAHLMQTVDPKERGITIMRYMSKIRAAARMMQLNTATQLITAKKMDKELKMSADELHAYEICAIDRYSKGDEAIVQISEILDKMCQQEKLEMKSFAIACQIMTESILKEIDLERFKEINSKLQSYCEKLDEDDIVVRLALAWNFYALYQLMIFERKDKFKQSDTSGIQIGKYCELVEKFQFEDEVKLLEVLDKSLVNFTNAVLCIRENEEARLKIISNMRLQRVIDNISISYLVRGIEYKDIEAQNVLWNFFTDDSSPSLILSSATVFLDNHRKLLDQSKNYIKLSKRLETVRIEDVLKKSLIAFEKLKEIFQQENDKNKAILVNYSLSLWHFYLVKGNVDEAQNWWKEYLELWELSKLSENVTYNGTFNAKISLGQVDAINHYYKKNALNILFNSIYSLLSVRNVSGDFNNLFQQIYRRVTSQAIEYSLNRMADLEHYNKLMISLKFMALSSGFYFRLCEYISLSILRHLNMEKLDFAKIELKELSTLLGINEEVLVESPMKSPMIVPSFNFEQVGMGARRSISASPSHILSLQSTSSDVVNQLKSFIHSDRCKCSKCEYPQMKFYSFQIACHYSRLLWMVGNYQVSKEFNDYALERWRIASQEVLRSKDSTLLSIKKKNFIIFSIRWLFQVADTLIKLKNYDESEEIYLEIDLICRPGIYDYECFQQALHVRKETLDHLVKNEKLLSKAEKSTERLSFETFLIERRRRKSSEPIEIKSSKTHLATPSLSLFAPPRTASTSSASSALKTPKVSSKKVKEPATTGKVTRTKKLAQEVIYIDSSDDEKKSESKPKRVVSKTPSTRKKPPQIDLTQETPKPSTSSRTRRMI